MDIESLLAHSPRLKPFVEGVFAITEERLSALNATTEKTLRQFSGKSVLDPLLGYIHLTRWEAVFLESELFQRLRRIRQLGLAHLVYPTLGYGRFEHTLGVLGRVSQILQRLKHIHGIDGYASDSQVIAAIDEHTIPLRLAALFHDLGHCIYSHVSERAISGLVGHEAYPSAAVISDAFTQHLQRKKRVPIAEVLSITTLCSPSVRKLLLKLQIPNKSEEQVERWISHAACFIAGMPADGKPGTVFLGQILSCGFDADKLDYMTRESYFSKIPLGIDEVRLFDKIRVFSCSAAHLPKDIAYLKELLPQHGDCKVLGFARGGQFAFEEFCLARVSLHDKIYLHQKIRAAEGQLLCYFQSMIASNSAFQEAHKWLKLEEGDFERAEVRPGLNIEPDDLFAQTFRTSQELGFSTIRSRQLLQRAFAFGVRNSLSDVLHGNLTPDEEPQTLRFFDWVRENRAAFHSAIIEEFRNISGLLKRQVTENLIGNIVIDVPNHRRVQQGQESMYFDRPTMLPLRWTLPLDQIVQYYENRSLAYIFAPREICALVALAAERIVWGWEKAGLLYVQDEGISSAVVKEMDRLRGELAKEGYYDKCLQLKPASAYLQSFAAQEQIDRVVNNLLRFRSWRGQRITAALVRAFVIQFPEGLHESALCLLEQVIMIEPSEVAAAVVAEYKTLKEQGADVVGVVPVGNLTDSAAHLLYELKNHPERDVRELGPQISALQATTIQVSDRLLFFDDNTNSGLQVLNVFADWLGVDLPEGADLGERHVDSLLPRAQEKLKKLKMSFVFGVAPEGAEARIQELFQTYLKIPSDQIKVTVSRELLKAKRLLSGNAPTIDIPKRVELRNFLDKVGREMMVKEGKTPENAELRALGEDRTEALVVFPYNTPTMTLTPLWCRGNYSNGEWMPLLERRRNVRSNGEFAGEDA